MEVGNVLIEACVETIDAARAAATAGAGRIEFCANLAQEGTTPVMETLMVCRARVPVIIPVFALVRPRPGYFVYSAAEHEVMVADVERLREAGAQGIVTGALREDLTIDEERTAALLAAARPLPVTFHRAFDVCPDPTRALETLVALGVERVLTAGRAATAAAGAAAIAKLVKLAAGRITVMAGGGVTGDNVAALVRTTGVPEVHLSTKDAEKVAKVVEALAPKEPDQSASR